MCFCSAVTQTVNSFTSLSGAKDNEADSDDDSSSDDAASPSRFEGAEFKSSLRNFEMSENKRTRLRELEVREFRVVRGLSSEFCALC